MATLEEELARLEERVAEAQKSAKTLAAALAKIKAAAHVGAIGEIEKGLTAIGQCGQEAAEAAPALPAAWEFDARAHLMDGFVGELRAAASAGGLDLIERDGRLSL